MESNKKIRVIGFGNILLYDEGIGIFIIEELKRFKSLKGVEFIDGGTNSLDLTFFIGDAKKAIIIDAVTGEGEIGDIYRIELNKLEGFYQRFFSLHEINWYDMLILNKTILENNVLKELIFYGIEIKNNIKYKIGLSQKLEKCIPKILNLILNELKG